MKVNYDQKYVHPNRTTTGSGVRQTNTTSRPAEDSSNFKAYCHVQSQSRLKVCTHHSELLITFDEEYTLSAWTAVTAVVLPWFIFHNYPCWLYRLAWVARSYPSVCLPFFVCLFVCLFVCPQHNSTRRMATANKTCVSGKN